VDLLRGGFVWLGGVSAPNRSGGANELGLPELAHSIEGLHRDCNRGHTSSFLAGFQCVADDTLVTAYGRPDL
jgi:hypothetical protein